MFEYRLKPLLVLSFYYKGKKDVYHARTLCLSLILVYFPSPGECCSAVIHELHKVSTEHVYCMECMKPFKEFMLVVKFVLLM